MKYPTQSPFNLETESDIPVKPKRPPNQIQIIRNWNGSPLILCSVETLLLSLRLSGYFLYYPVHWETLTGSLSAPPIAVVCSKYHFSVVLQHICHKRCDKPPFEDISIFIEVLQFIPETFIVFHEFFHDKILVVENQSLTICCVVISYKRKMPSLVRTAG